MMALATVAVAARLYARRLRKAALAWDDYTILAALFFTLGTAILMFVGATMGGLGRHGEIDDTGMPVWNERLIVFLQINYVSLITGTLTIGLTKVSVILLYRRIFRGSSGNRIFNFTTWFLLGTCIVWTVAFLAACVFQCHPIDSNWLELSAGKCIDENMMYLGQAFSDSITDLMILLVPIPCVWNLHMPAKQKVAVTGMFLLGILTITASVTKLVYFYQIMLDINEGDADITCALSPPFSLPFLLRPFFRPFPTPVTPKFSTNLFPLMPLTLIIGRSDAFAPDLLSPTVYWPMIESSLGITGACLPLLKPILDSHSTRLRAIIPSLTFPSLFSTRSSRRGLVTDEEKASKLSMGSSRIRAGSKGSQGSVVSLSAADGSNYAHGKRDFSKPSLSLDQRSISPTSVSELQRKHGYTVRIATSPMSPPKNGRDEICQHCGMGK
ncbi:hypothetical protein MMC21_005557 [Puttea exsequens]|nr:hypothetical protein [Puttea exsequens]